MYYYYTGHLQDWAQLAPKFSNSSLAPTWAERGHNYRAKFQQDGKEQTQVKDSYCINPLYYVMKDVMLSRTLFFSHIHGPHCQCAENRIAYSRGVLKAIGRGEGRFCVVLLSVFQVIEP